MTILRAGLRPLLFAALTLVSWPAAAEYEFFPRPPAQERYDEYRRELAEAKARVAIGSELAQTACGLIEYASLGEGPAVLLVHGAGGGFDQTLDYAKQLSAAGFRAVTMSRFGYLRTPLPRDASPAAQADAHACLLDALQIERATVIGVSAGAPSSMQFALRHRDRCTAMALLVPITYSPEGDVQAATMGSAPPRVLFEALVKSDFLFWLGMKFAPTLIARTVLATPPQVLESASAKERRRFARMMALALPLSQRHIGLLNDVRIVSALARYEIEKIVVPALLLSVADDLYGTYESTRYTAAQIPGARFVGYPTGGHLWVGHDDAVVTELKAFIRRHSRVSAASVN